MVLTVNGVNMIPYIAHQGLKYSINDVDGPNAGRTQDGTMERDRVARKVRWDVTCRPLRADELSTVLSAISREWLTVTYTNPETGYTTTSIMYTNNIPAQYLIQKGDVEYWAGVTFPLVEK